MNERRQSRHHALTPRARRRSESGAVAVEFALIVPILVMLLLGMVTAGVTYSRGISMTNAVREGARFAAVGDSSSASWATDTISRIRATQIDDSSSETAICVQLWKQGGGEIKVSCSQGNGSVSPALATTDASFPAVPSGLSTNTCVVRVLAARNYQITLGIFPALRGTMKRGSVARYERSSC